MHFFQYLDLLNSSLIQFIETFTLCDAFIYHDGI